MAEHAELSSQTAGGAAAAAGGTGSMRLWMDVMRHLEPLMANHERWFDAENRLIKDLRF